MNRRRWIRRVGVVALLTLAGGTAALVAWREGQRRTVTDVRRRLVAASTDRTFEPGMVVGMPDPAQRWLLSAIEVGAPLASVVNLEIEGRMKPSPDGSHLDLSATERLVGLRGFIWEARAPFGPLSVQITDHYLAGEGAVHVSLLGWLPLQVDDSPEVARSSRHRLAAEHVWIPSALLPGDQVRWRPLDPQRAEVTLDIDGEEVPFTVTVDEDGRLREVVMQRYGDVTGSWGLTPYGFRVDDTATFSGQRIATALTGGWWYGTDQYSPNDASTFRIVGATFE